MTITLPDELKDELERGAKTGGFASVDEYVLIMYLRARHIHEPNEAGPLDDFDFGLADDPDSTERVAKQRERLNRILQEGLDSGPSTPITPQFWEDMRRQLEERLAAKGTPK